MTVPGDLRRAVEELPAPLLVALDVDGVLAPILATPEEAQVLPSSARLLPGLAATAGLRLAFVSGRSLADLRRLVDPPAGAYLVGSHGAERQSPGRAPVGPSPDPTLLARVRALVDGVVATTPGTRREDKPAGVVLHTRGARRADADAAAARTEAAAADLDGVQVRAGKEVVELSVVTADKGSAVLAVRDEVGAIAVLYVGDDVTDEDVFAVLASGDVGVKVGPEATRAAYRVPDPGAVSELLEAVLVARGG